MSEPCSRGMAHLVSGLQVAWVFLCIIGSWALIGAGVFLYPEAVAFIIGGTGVVVLAMMVAAVIIIWR